MIVVEDGFSGVAYPLDHPRIGAHFIGGTVTASSAAAGYPAAFAADAQTWKKWRPTAMGANWTLTFSAAAAVSFAGIAAHDLGSKATEVRVQTWTGSAWITRILHYPTDNSPIFALMRRRAGLDRIRFAFAGASVPTIGVLVCGDVIELPQKAEYVGSESFEGVDQVEFRDTISESGQVLERFAERRTIPARMEINHLPEPWVDAYGRPLRDWMKARPIFMADRPSRRPQSLVYGLAPSLPAFSRRIAKASVAISTSFEVMGHDAA